jgi:hypothetical protein
MNARKLLPITVALVLPWLTISEAKAARYLVYSSWVSLAQGQYLQLAFNKIPGVNYEICAIPYTGDVDVYAHWVTWATQQSYEYSSTLGGTATDCVSFYNPYDEWYYYSFYGYTETTFRYYVYEY